MAPPYPSTLEHRVNVVFVMLSIPDVLTFPRMMLPFPSVNEMFSAQRELTLSASSVVRVMMGALTVSMDDMSGVILTDDSVSNPLFIAKSGQVIVLVDVSLNMNKSNERSPLLFVITNTPSPVTLDTLRSTAEGSDEERKSTVHPFDITIPFVSAVLTFPD